MDGLSLDLEKENINKIKELFPEAVEEGKINFDMLRAFLGDEVDDSREKYQFTWNGKAKSIKLAQASSSATLRPCKQKSKNWDTTENLYIEGDNLEVLKQLQKTYYGKIKMIYIDPPYNTGNDFVYNDSFSNSIENYKEQTSQASSSNPETNGRFHTDWLNMMYPRLILAKNLLSDDGVIFISIDDCEQTNLKKCCDDIFGENNFICMFIWKGGRRNAAKFISTSHEYILTYAKDLKYCNDNNISWHEKKRGLEKIYKAADEFVHSTGDYKKASELLKEWYKSLPEDDDSKASEHYNNIDERGVYFASDISRGGGGGPTWEIVNPETGNIVKTPQRGWAYGNLDDLLEDIKNGLIHFNGDGVPCKKRYLKDNETQLKETVFYKDRRGSSKRLRKMMEGDIFTFPKDEEIICDMLGSFTDSNSTILDFFSGSASTAHAVMKLNAEDGGDRKFIMIQLPELCEEKSEAHKAGYKNICEIGEERIRRAGEQIKTEWEKEHPRDGLFASEETFNTDIGFKVFKLDSTNLIPWDNSDKYNEVNLYNLNNIFKEDRNSEDVLYEIMLKYGVFDKQVEEIEVNGKTMYRVGKRYMIVCLDNNVTTDDIKAIGELSPRTVIFKESGFVDDNAKINAVYNLEKAGVEDVKCI